MAECIQPLLDDLAAFGPPQLARSMGSDSRPMGELSFYARWTLRRRREVNVGSAFVSSAGFQQILRIKTGLRWEAQQAENGPPVSLEHTAATLGRWLLRVRDPVF